MAARARDTAGTRSLLTASGGAPMVKQALLLGVFCVERDLYLEGAVSAWSPSVWQRGGLQLLSVFAGRVVKAVFLSTAAQTGVCIAAFHAY